MSSGNSKEIVIVSTYQRSEMLWLCLEAIRFAEPEIAIHCFPDRGTKEHDICQRFNATEHLTIRHNYHGNTFNLLEAYKWALTRPWERLYIIEDDAIVHSTFFSWCREALDREPEMFAACGWQYSPNAIIADGPDVRIPWFLSVATCLPRASVQAIAAHATPYYYDSMQSYVDAAFPHSPNRGSLHYEQDGLTLRLMQSQSKRCIWPRRPRATHCGFHGYHQGENKMEGTLEERVNILRLAIKNPLILQRLMSGGRIPELTQCRVCGKPLLKEIKGTAKVAAVCVQCFHEKYPTLPVTAAAQYYLPALDAVR